MRRMLVFQAGPDAQPRGRRQPRGRVDRGGPRHRRGGLPEPRRHHRRRRAAAARAGQRRSTSTASRLLIEASGLEARVLQHEIDHLDGVLILDRTDPRAAPRGAARAARGRELRPVHARARRPRTAPPGTRIPQSPRSVERGVSEPPRASTSAPRISPRRSCGLLAGSPHRPALVVTPPDRRAGPRPAARLPARRGGRAGARHRAASDSRASTTPDSLAAIEARRGPSVGVVCAFGQLIGEPLLDGSRCSTSTRRFCRAGGAPPRSSGRSWPATSEHRRLRDARDRRPRLRPGRAARGDRRSGADEDYGSLAGATRGDRRPAPRSTRLDRRRGRSARASTEQADEGVTYAEKIEPRGAPAGSRAARRSPRRAGSGRSRPTSAPSPSSTAASRLGAAGRRAAARAEAAAGEFARRRRRRCCSAARRARSSSRACSRRAAAGWRRPTTCAATAGRRRRCRRGRRLSASTPARRVAYETLRRVFEDGRVGRPGAALRRRARRARGPRARPGAGPRLRRRAAPRHHRPPVAQLSGRRSARARPARSARRFASALYELLFAGGDADHAAVDQAVALAKGPRGRRRGRRARQRRPAPRRARARASCSAASTTPTRPRPRSRTRCPRGSPSSGGRSSEPRPRAALLAAINRAPERAYRANRLRGDARRRARGARGRRASRRTRPTAEPPARAARSR